MVVGVCSSFSSNNGTSPSRIDGACSEEAPREVFRGSVADNVLG